MKKTITIGALLIAICAMADDKKPTPPIYWSIQHPNWPPLPEAPDGAIVYQFADGFLLDDSKVIYPAPEPQPKEVAKPVVASFKCDETQLATQEQRDLTKVGWASMTNASGLSEASRKALAERSEVINNTVNQITK